MASVTKDTIIIDVLRMDQGTAPFFLEIGMHCLGCPSASGESIAEACAVHGVDAFSFVSSACRFYRHAEKSAKCFADFFD